MKMNDSVKAFNTYIHAIDRGRGENVCGLHQGVALCPIENIQRKRIIRNIKFTAIEQIS